MASRWCVIFNPHSGRGRAAMRLTQFREKWGEQAIYLPTERPGHAEELARQAACDGYQVVIAAGGDGTAHEVANGLLTADNRDVALGILPIGSANDYAHSIAKWQADLADGSTSAVDVGVVTDSSGRQRYFICCLGLGFNGMVTLESRKIKRLQGLALYGLATLRALWYHHACPLTEIRMDDQPMASWPTLMLSVLLGRREGGFVLAPDALLDDGWFDYVHACGLSRWQVLRLLPRLALAGPPKNDPLVRLGRCRQITLRSPTPLAIHVDGEFFAQPGDNVCQIQIHIEHRRLRIHHLLPD